MLTENNSEITLTQSQVVAKGMSYSDILGMLIRFAVSPFGMMIVAIVPCIIIIILEIVKFAGKIMPQPEVETIKKQYEVPTYVPDADKTPRLERRGKAEAAKAYRTASLDRSIGIYDTGISDRCEPEAPACRHKERVCGHSGAPAAVTAVHESDAQAAAEVCCEEHDDAVICEEAYGSDRGDESGARA